MLRRYRTGSEDVDLLLHAARAATVRVEVAPPSAAPSDGLAARWAGVPMRAYRPLETIGSATLQWRRLVPQPARSLLMRNFLGVSHRLLTRAPSRSGA